MSDEATKVPADEGAHDRLNELHVRVNGVEADTRSLRSRLETIERALSRQVGQVLDIVETAAGFVSSAAGGTVGAVADVVKAVAEKVEEFVCPNGGSGPEKNCSCGAKH